MNPVHRIPCLVAAMAALAVNGCGASPSEAPPPAHGRPVAGTYVGETSQGLPIRFVVSSGGVSDVTFEWRARCADGEIHANTIVLPGNPIRHRAFTVGGTLETGGIAHVSGRFNTTEAAGGLSRSKGSAFGTDCRATGIAWHAHRESGPDPIPPPEAPGNPAAVTS